MLKARFKIAQPTIARAITIVSATLEDAPAIVIESDGRYTTIVASAQIVMFIIGEVANLGESGLQFVAEV